MKIKPLNILGLATFTAALLSLPLASHASVPVVVAGELVVDLRAEDLDASTNVWSNNVTTAGVTVGNFSTVGGGNLNVASVDGVGKALYIGGDRFQSVVSALNAPLAIQGNGTRSVEAWVYTISQTNDATAVGWGVGGDPREMSSFRNVDTAGKGMFSSWANDAGWGDFANPVGEWVYYVWTWDGSNMRGYVNGSLVNTVALSSLETANARISVGSARAGVVNPINGYIADVRVHTGVLSASDVLNNYNVGIIPEPSSLALACAALCLTVTFAFRKRARAKVS